MSVAWTRCRRAYVRVLHRAGPTVVARRAGTRAWLGVRRRHTLATAAGVYRAGHTVRCCSGSFAPPQSRGAVRVGEATRACASAAHDCVGDDAGTQPAVGAGEPELVALTVDSPALDLNAAAEGTTVVRTRQDAERVLSVLRSLPADTFHACDTETVGLDLASQSPVGNGRVTCASVFSGPDVDFGNGPRLWIDNLDDADGTLMCFKEWFEDESVLKVWHNYSFDRAVMHNHGINVMGLGGDTMHMARLWNTARSKGRGYGLENLTEDLLGRRKVPMKELFSLPKLKKDGSPGKERYVPPLDDVQRSLEWREAWIGYSTYDAEGTWYLRNELERLLKTRPWAQNDTMYEFYMEYLVPFAEVLTEIERVGIKVDVEHRLPAAERAAIADRDASERHFLDWATSYCADAARMNVGSDAQKAHFLFAPTQRQRRGRQAAGGSDNSEWPQDRAFKVDNVEEYIEPGKTKPKKQRDIILRGLGIAPVQRTAAGWPAVSGAVLRELAGDVESDPPQYGTAFEHFGGGQAGRDACHALHHLYTVSAVETMLSNFILPLQQMADRGGRVHCSLNLNTETGRLSARRPNLQNQPALEKDRYKIRDAFTCEPGNTLVVADYGQLELRVLAHMSKCVSMIEAFEAGGDFHSRTAVGMYPYIKEKIDAGEVLLEEGDGEGQSGLPLVKDLYGSERRKAKVLNFSIAYGKTAMGLSKDWGVSVQEAKETLERWYADRPEVKAWQANVIEAARRDNATRTLMGRYRDLPGINARHFGLRGHAERAAINTPIQGGASDIVMMAMLKLSRNQRLKELGWRMILQVHDEVIMEGPKESSEEAMQMVIDDMCSPFEKPLLVALEVDAKCADTWYAAK